VDIEVWDFSGIFGDFGCDDEVELTKLQQIVNAQTWKSQKKARNQPETDICASRLVSMSVR
jgi:hypothetical protein